MLQNGDTYKKKYCQEWYINDSKSKWKNRKTSKPLADNKSASKWKHLEIKKYCQEWEMLQNQNEKNRKNFKIL